MARYKYDRLSAQDNDFLLWEKPNLPMHGGAVLVFAAEPLRTAEGGIDVALVKRGLTSILHKVPRYRQRLAWIPGEEHAVWVDDAHFNLDYHVRHTALPRPGTDEQLKQLTARVLERPLDRDRPLWEWWVVEGLSDDRFAIITKTHHCIMDGISGMVLAQSLFSPTPEYTLPEAPPFVPRPVPTPRELRRDERLRLLALPLRALEELREFVEHTEDLPRELLERLRVLGRMAMWKIAPSSDTPLNGPVGPHRVVDWLTVPLADVKAIRRGLECSVNDVVLGILTGAVRDFMTHRHVLPEKLEFRVATPVNVRGERDWPGDGNRVSTWIVRLPLEETDPRGRVARIREVTKELKASRQAGAIEMVEALHEFVAFDIQALSKGTQNMFISNVPGPQVPLYFLGARLFEIDVQPPLIENLGLVIAVVSYDGQLHWGFNADPVLVPDLREFSTLVHAAFEHLAEAAGVHVGGETLQTGARGGLHFVRGS